MLQYFKQHDLGKKTITENDLKVKGINTIKEAKMNELRALELDKAYLETMQEIKDGKYKTIATDEELREHLEDL